MADKLTAEEAEALKNPKPPPAKVKGASDFPPEEGLEILGPDTEEMTFKIREGTKLKEVKLVVGPMTMGQIGPFMALAESFIPMIQAGIGQDKSFSLTKLVNQPGFMQSIAIAVGCEEAFLKTVLPTDFMRLVTKVLVVNLDFFLQTLPMAMGGFQASVLAEAKRLTAGATESKS